MINEIVGCWLAVIVLWGYNVLLTALFLNYKVKWDKWKITIEHKEKQQDSQDQIHEERIKKVEEKNGHELEEINRLNGKIDLMQEFINKHIIFKPKETHDTPKAEAPKGNIPIPPAQPTKKTEQTEQKPRQEQEKPRQKTHKELLDEALEKRRKKIEGEDNKN